MTTFTLSEMTGHIGAVLNLDFPEAQALHRAIKNLVARDVLKPTIEGETGTSADLYSLHTMCMARVFACLKEAKWEVPTFHRFLQVPDHMVEGAGRRSASGLANAVQAAIDGKSATVRFDIIDRNGGIRGHFEHSAPAANAEVDRIIAAQEAVRGADRVVASITLHINALVDPILERVGAN